MLETVFRRTRDIRLAVVILTVGVVHLLTYFAAASIYGSSSTGMFVEYMMMLGIAMVATATILFAIEAFVLRDRPDSER